MSGLCYEGYLHIQHILEEEHEHISKRILWRPKMVSPMELDELRAIFLQNFDIHAEDGAKEEMHKSVEKEENKTAEDAQQPPLLQS